MPSRNVKKTSVTMARILGNTFTMEARLSTKKTDSSQPSMIAIPTCKLGKYMSLKKRTRVRRPMNENESILWNHLVRRRQTKSKLAKQV